MKHSKTTKADLVEITMHTGQVKKAVAEDIVGAIFALIGDSLARGEEVHVPGFGSYRTRASAARTGRNPQTGQPITIAPSRRVTFHASLALRRSVKPIPEAPPATRAKPASRRRAVANAAQSMS